MMESFLKIANLEKLLHSCLAGFQICLYMLKVTYKDNRLMC